MMKSIYFSLLALVLSSLISGCLSTAQLDAARDCGYQYDPGRCWETTNRNKQEQERERAWDDWSQGVQAEMDWERPSPTTIRELKWKSWLSSLDMTLLEEQGKKYPTLSWLAGTWCGEGSEQDLPTHYFRISPPHDDRPVEQISQSTTAYTGLSFSPFKHVVIAGNYYDLWSWTPSNNERERFDLVRLEKRSDREYAVVYKKEYSVLYKHLTYDPEKNDLGPEVYGLVEKKSAKIGPMEHIQNPEVFTQCDYRPSE